MASSLPPDPSTPPDLLDELVGEMGLGVFAVDPAGVIRSWSRGAETLTGFAAADVVGRSHALLEARRGGAGSGLGELLATDADDDPGLVRDVFAVRTRERGDLDVQGHLRVLRDGDGRVEGALCVLVPLARAPAAPRPTAPGRPSETFAGMVGVGPAMAEVFRRVRLAADSDVTTLVSGESGTGKELVARAVHGLSARHAAPVVAVNCAAIPEPLLESELFGHVRGAFTGALHDRAGLFEQARGGTLFLDEVGDLSPALQVKLLRALQEREVRPVGSDRSVPIDVRLICATHRDLRERVANEQMREDFYYRIRVFEIALPPLRERREDIPLLSRHMLGELAGAAGREAPELLPEALAALVRHGWPGNVRELRNALEHALVVCRGERLAAADLPEEVRDGTTATADEPVAAEAWTADQRAERAAILDALEAHGWNRTRTAQALGISRVTLWKRIGQYALDEGPVRRAGRR